MASALADIRQTLARLAHNAHMPSPWIITHAAPLPAGSAVLDLACGHGRHARWLAAQGHHVLAVDRDGEALATLADIRGVKTMQADLEDAPWPLAGAQFDAVIVSRYLHRPLFPHIFAAVRPGGYLIYETFMLGNERYGRPSRPDFLLAVGELKTRVTKAGWRVIDSFEGYVEQPNPSLIQAICAQRPTETKRET